MGGRQNVSGGVVFHVFHKGILYCWRGKMFQVECFSCVSLVTLREGGTKYFRKSDLPVFHRGRYIVGGGQNISCRVILHVFHRGH